jgi:RNA polymerase sigma-70 factor (ECF subfamily)
LHFRRHRPTQSLDALYEEQGFEPIADYNLAEEIEAAQTNLERHQLALQALAHLKQLPMKYQEVLILRFVEQKKVAEIAEILNKREGTIKSLLSRGLAKLRQTINTQIMQPISTSRIVGSEGRITPIKPKEEYER